MRFLFRFIWTICLLILSGGSLHAQDSDPWRAWLRDSDGQVVRVDGEGQVQRDVVLPPFDPVGYSDFLPGPPADLFPQTGEAILIVSDARFPMLPDQPNNTLQVYDPTSRSRYPFYSNGEVALVDAWFVQNGRQILLHCKRAEPDLPSVWLLIERDGSVAWLLPPVERQEVRGTVNGFVYTRLREDGTTELVAYDLARPLLERVVWAGEGVWELVQVENQPTTYGPFRMWAQLAEPVSETPQPEETIAPTPFPPPPPLMSVGEQALVQTIDGEVLYMRDAPLTGEIVFHLLDGMIVDLLEGPVQAGDFTWWRLRTWDDIEGWAAQAFEDVTTLIPYREPVEEDE